MEAFSDLPSTGESVDTSRRGLVLVYSAICLPFTTVGVQVKCFVAAFQHLFSRLFFPKLSGSPSDAHYLDY
ncbi:hypothetical protein ACROYT_G027131 [Oculina patagonica]